MIDARNRLPMPNTTRSRRRGTSSPKDMVNLRETVNIHMQGRGMAKAEMI